MTDIARAFEEVRTLPDQALQQEMSSPSGMLPGFIVLGEIAERKAIRNKGNAPGKTTVMQDLMGASQGQGASQGFAAGGIVSQFNPLMARYEAMKDPAAARSMNEMAMRQQGGNMPALQAPGGLADLQVPASINDMVPEHGGIPQPPQRFARGGAVSKDYIRQGLMQRGLPPHVAEAFIWNFQDESGLNPGIQEHAPIVPGSRGGRGLYQLTGPRRRAYEGQYGTGYDVDSQLDFLMSELQGPEARAAQSILGAPDANSAASAIVNKFLRPAESHRVAREAKYMGMDGSAVADQLAAGQAAQQQMTQQMPQQQEMASAAAEGGGIMGIMQMMQMMQPPQVDHSTEINADMGREQRMAMAQNPQEMATHSGYVDNRRRRRIA